MERESFRNPVKVWFENHSHALYTIGSQIRKGRQRNEMKSNTQRKCGSEKERQKEKEWEKPRERQN